MPATCTDCHASIRWPNHHESLRASISPVINTPLFPSSRPAFTHPKASNVKCQAISRTVVLLAWPEAPSQSTPIPTARDHFFLIDFFWSSSFFLRKFCALGPMTTGKPGVEREDREPAHRSTHRRSPIDDTNFVRPLPCPPRGVMDLETTCNFHQVTLNDQLLHDFTADYSTIWVSEYCLVIEAFAILLTPLAGASWASLYKITK